MCKFDNAEKFTGCSTRHGSISKMPTTSGVVSSEILGHARHKSMYQSCNTSTSDHRNSCFMIGSNKSSGNNPTTFIQQVPPLLYHYPGTVPYNQYLFPIVQYHAPATYHNQSICTNYGNVTGANPTDLAPDSCGTTNYKD
jgi:hypothetical protein